MERKLTTVLFTSVESYRELLDLDEEKAIQVVHEFRELYEKLLNDYRGRVFARNADEANFEFQSPVNAAKFAIICQQELHERSKQRKLDPPLLVRMAINVGDVVFDDGQPMGSAIHMASELGRLADPGGLWVPMHVHNEIYNKVGGLRFIDLGERKLDGVRLATRLFALDLPGRRVSESTPPVAAPSAAVTPPGAAPRAPTASDAGAASLGAAGGGTEINPAALAGAKSNQELIALLMRERNAATVSISSAHRLLITGNVDEACLVFLARVVRKKDFSAMVELLGMARNKTISERLRAASAAVFENYSESLLSHRNMTVVGQLFADGVFGAEQRKTALRVWRIAARKDVEAMRLLGYGLLDQPGASEQDVNDALEVLEQAARKQNAKAALRLGTYYSNPLLIAQHKTQAFQWFWLARHLKEPLAQEELENMAKSIKKEEFPAMRIAADALVEEVEWNTRYNL